LSTWQVWHEVWHNVVSGAPMSRVSLCPLEIALTKRHQIIAWQSACQQLINSQVRLGMRLPAWRHRCWTCMQVLADCWHHPNYRQPEMVVALCWTCHHAAHRATTFEWEWLEPRLREIADGQLISDLPERMPMP